MDRHRIAIVIPALNEASTISDIAIMASQYGVPIVVDDGSNDATSTSAQAAGAKVIRHNDNRGYDQSLNSGFKYASELGCEYVITMDADGQHDPTTLGEFILCLNSGADVVVGIRDQRQRLAEHVFAWVSSTIWGIRDPLCGLKAYRVGVYRDLGHFDSYGSIGTELAIFASKKCKKIAQLPIKVGRRKDASRFGKKYSANKKIMRALWLGALYYIIT
jgi:glycosyltransferase involved in cell wall biosynthesis